LLQALYISNVSTLYRLKIRGRVAERHGNVAACTAERRFGGGMLRDSRIERRNAAEAVGSLGGRIGVIVIVLHHIVAGRSHGTDHRTQRAKAGVVGGFRDF
jgi:hypothetical protein